MYIQNTPRTYRWLLQANGEVEEVKKNPSVPLSNYFFKYKINIIHYFNIQFKCTEEVH